METDISLEIGELENAIAVTEDFVEKLTVKLLPVLRAGVIGGNAPDKREEGPATCPMANILREYRERLQCVNITLRELIEEIQL